MQGALASATPDTGAVLPGVRWALARDLRLALRSRAELGVQLLFYVIVVTLFPLATTPERNLLATMGPGVLWVAALLACMLSLARLFAPDHQDGTLEQMLLAGEPLVVLVMGKVISHWLVSGSRGCWFHSSIRMAGICMDKSWSFCARRCSRN